jgi:hypothetical protein
MLSHCLYAMFWLPTYQILREHYGVEIKDWSFCCQKPNIFTPYRT